MIKSEKVYENIRILHVEEKNREVLLKELAEYAIRNGLAKEGYENAIIEREKHFPTGISAITGIAIPHADQQYTIQESVVIALLENDCVFGEMASDRFIDVSIVFMLILNNNKQVEALSRLVQIIQSEKQIQSLYQDDACKQLYDSFGKYLK